MKDPLAKLEATAYAVGYSVLGLWFGARIVRDWLHGAIDRALTFGVRL